MATTFRIRRSDGVIVISGLSADDATLTIMDAPPSAGTYTYYLEIIANTYADSRILTMLQALQVKK